MEAGPPRVRSRSYKPWIAKPFHGRGIVTLVVLAMYMFSGVAHGLCDALAFGQPSAVSLLSIDGDMDPSESGMAAEHHCHGCFAVSVPPWVAAAIRDMPSDTLIANTILAYRAASPDIDPPPPKSMG